MNAGTVVPRQAIFIAVLALLAACEQPQAPDITQERSRSEALPNHAAPAGIEKVSAEVYRRAERFLTPSKMQYILNDSVIPNWMGKEERFWYLRRLHGGAKQFVVVDATSGAKQPAFDHAAVALSLNALLEEKTTAESLPFDTFTFVPGIEGKENGGIEFKVGTRSYHCDSDGCRTLETPKPIFTSTETPSPDGQWAIYFKDHNLWLKSADGATDRALTTDGEEAWGYGTQVGSSTDYISVLRLMGGHAPQVVWAPDSSKILTQRIDERGVGTLSLTEYLPANGSSRPLTYTMRYAYAGDEVKPKGTFVVFDVPGGRRQDIDYEPIELIFKTLTAPDSKEVWWRHDSAGFGFIHRAPYSRGYSIHRVDLASGTVTTEFERTSEGPSYAGLTNGSPPIVMETKDGSLIWYSDENGFGHLYRKDAKGSVIQLTSGEWNVSMISRVDEESGRVYFIGSQPESAGDPYFFFNYSVALDGSDLRQLTPEQANHGSPWGLPWTYSPSGKYLVDSWSTTTQPGQSELRDNAGTLITVLETTDISSLEVGGFVPPKPFTVLADDGKTNLYGTLFYPSNFDPEKSYPVIDSIYPGPQAWRDQHRFSGSIYLGFVAPQALAEIGFIVVSVDGRGTPGRSRDFQHPLGVNILDKAGYLEDHVAAIKQLAEKEPYIDVNHVGIWGWSGGGYASTHAMFTYPDFFKVAVSGAGNHDPRTYLPIWGESYLGPNENGNYEAGSNAHLAAQLQGKLLLVFGMMDDNVNPGNTVAVVETLIRANKDFDLLILPNANHLPGDYEAYFTRRMWDFFVTHLMGAQPPQGYVIGQADNVVEKTP